MAFEEYICHGKQKLRLGYTTGTCAAAAAKAAAMLLLTGKAPDSVTLLTPKGISVPLAIESPSLTKDSARCAVRKDGGDDPDVTDGILIFASVGKIPHGIVIDGGEGVGRVTRPGLDQPVGAAAINSVPRRMITEAVMEVCDECRYDGGIAVTVSIPEGRALAARTYNPRMGIEGGLSVIGTTGIVEPMSSAALVETIRTELRMRAAQEHKSLLLTVGNYSHSFLAREMPFLQGKSVTCSNFIGEAIDAALEYDFRKILLVGHIGKLVKLGAGIMNTHSAQADGRMDVLVTCAVLAGVTADGLPTLRQLPACVTVDAALALLDGAGIRQATCDVLLRRVQEALDAKVKGNAAIGAVLFSDKFGIIGRTSGAEGVIQSIIQE